MKLFSNSINFLEQGLDYSSLRQKMISQNIANVDTPNYKAKDVSFRTEFDQALQSQMQAFKTDPKHLDFKYGSSSMINIEDRNDTSYNENGNNVDIDNEMSLMAENQIYNQALVDRLNNEFNSLKMVIRGGK